MKLSVFDGAEEINDFFVFDALLLIHVKRKKRITKDPLTSSTIRRMGVYP